VKRIIRLFIFLLIPAGMAGQQTPVTSQYVLNPLSINPASAGNRGALNIAAFYRRQWTGISGAPETLTLALDAPILDSRLGLGFIVENDKLGVTKETRFSSVYAYKMKMKGGDLSLGLGAGIVTTNSAWSDLVVIDPGDENYLVDSRVFVVPDFSFGLLYSSANYYAGISVPKLLEYKFNYDNNKYTLLFDPGEFNYLINTGYIFDLSKSVKLFPSTLIDISPGDKLLIDLNIYVGLNDVVWAGFSYRSDRSCGALIQYAISNQLKVAYTYDFDFNKLQTYSNGSHEIMFRYEFRYKVDAISPLNF
jgi:type IX secretion system PorP/SprF family membrane protein